MTRTATLTMAIASRRCKVVAAVMCLLLAVGKHVNIIAESSYMSASVKNNPWTSAVILKNEADPDVDIDKLAAAAPEMSSSLSNREKNTQPDDNAGTSKDFDIIAKEASSIKSGGKNN
jgi:hypothetical protein